MLTRSKIAKSPSPGDKVRKRSSRREEEAPKRSSTRLRKKRNVEKNDAEEESSSTSAQSRSRQGPSSSQITGPSSSMSSKSSSHQSRKNSSTRQSNRVSSPNNQTPGTTAAPRVTRALASSSSQISGLRSSVSSTSAHQTSKNSSTRQSNRVSSPNNQTSVTPGRRVNRAVASPSSQIIGTPSSVSSTSSHQSRKNSSATPQSNRVASQNNQASVTAASRVPRVRLNRVLASSSSQSIGSPSSVSHQSRNNSSTRQSNRVSSPNNQTSVAAAPRVNQASRVPRVRLNRVLASSSSHIIGPPSSVSSTSSHQSRQNSSTTPKSNRDSSPTNQTPGTAAPRVNRDVASSSSQIIGPPSSVSSTSATQSNRVSSPNNQTSVTAAPVPEVNRALVSSSSSVVTTALPGMDLFPQPLDTRVVQKQKLKDLSCQILNIMSKIFNEVQDEEASISRLYSRVDKLYNCAEVYRYDVFIERYHLTFVQNVWIMATSVFKNSLPANKFATQIWEFLEYCFTRLGWEIETEAGERNRQKGVFMKRKKNAKYESAAYYAVKLFTKSHGDPSQYSRQCQLNFLDTLVHTAANAGNKDFIKFVAETVTTAVTIRLKDKSIQCRLKAITILSYFTRLDNVDTRDILKEIKFYTRYDPSVEVRKLGTSVLAATQMRLRFFYDQAFDKSLSVRYEAFKAFVVQENGELVRDMGQLNPEKLCKVVVWGMDFSDSRCRDLMTQNILQLWLSKCCDNNLTSFLSKLDAYEHMKAVMKILNVLLTEEIVETLDLKFIEATVNSILEHKYKNVCIEAMVGWQVLCSISQRIPSLASKVIPDVTKILAIVEALHKCALIESAAATRENRSEDITPVICLTVALQLIKHVTFEEGNRRHFVNLLQQVLLDPLLDEKPLVVQAVHTLHSYVSEDEYNHIIMSIFQDIFDPKSDIAHSNAHESMEVGSDGADVDMADDIEVNRAVGLDEVENLQISAGVDGPPPQREEEDVTPTPQPLTRYQMTKLREQLCDLKANRLDLQNRRDALMKEKRFVDAIPINEQILLLMEQEDSLNNDLDEQEKLARQAALAAVPNNNVVEINPPRIATLVANNARVSLAPPAAAALDAEAGESMHQDVEEEPDDTEENNNASCIINTVEQGLVKGLCMINAHMDLKGKLDAFVRNIYDNHLPNFLMEADTSIYLHVLKFLTKIALCDKRELRKITRVMITTIRQPDTQTEVKHITYQSLVDMVVSYDYQDFLLSNEEKLEEEYLHPYKPDFTKFLREYLGDPAILYEDATPQDMQTMFTKLFSDKFLNEQRLGQDELNVLNTTKNQGLLKLLIRGRIRDPTVISSVLELWVNHDYIGTPVLRDLEHVLQLFKTFQWWGKEAMQDENATNNVQMRVLAESLAEAVIHLSQDKRTSVGDDLIEKFVTYILRFLDTDDEELMTYLTSLFMDAIALKPTRSYNDALVKCAMIIPLKSHEAATAVVNSINGINESLKQHPTTTSVGNLRTIIKKFVAKIKRVFGNDVVANIRDGDNSSHGTSDPEDENIFGDSEEEVEGNDEGEDAELKVLVSDTDDQDV